jgi:YidC/Oxa1 family membrane protein insertase
MNQELRFILAIGLMILVLVGTNIIFPAPPLEEIPAGAALDSAALSGQVDPDDRPASGAESAPRGAIVIPADSEATGAPSIPAQENAPQELETSTTGVAGETIIVETPLFRLRFSSLGAELTSIELLEFESFAHEGLVQVLPTDEGVLGARVTVRGQEIDLSGQLFQVSSSSFTLAADGPSRDLVFTYQHPVQDFSYEVTYTFHPDQYLIDARAEVTGVDRPLLVADLGYGISYNESKPSEEARSMGYAVNHVADGITAVLHRKVDEPRTEPGPFIWAAHKSKYFVLAFMAGDGTGGETYIGEVRAEPNPAEDMAHLEATLPFGVDGTVDYRLYVGPQSFDRLTSFQNDLEDVNPYGWRFIRPVIRPVVGLVMFVLTGLHKGLSLGYGWVLIIFGVAMRIVLFPLNHKAMKAQMRNMAVQPLMQDIQKRYKDNPERLQKEMMKLYKDHGFNPLAGCLPMLIPYPVLITLFFVFQNTIELRGVPFLWLPSLSGPDPLFILPVLLGASMFLMQWITLRVTPNPNPQMKMMMWIMPIMMMFIFLNFASGLNLYYATANLATLPQQIWIAKERAKVKPIPIPSD